MVDEYDAGGRKKASIRDGVRTDYTNDANGRLLGQQTAGGWATFVYDSAGNTLTKWYQGQAPRTMTYDAAGRIVTQLFASATTTFLFDRAGNQTLEQSKWRHEKM